jgi:hypothetical protein
VDIEMGQPVKDKGKKKVKTKKEKGHKARNSVLELRTCTTDFELGKHKANLHTSPKKQ